MVTVTRGRAQTTFGNTTEVPHPVLDVFGAVMSPEIAPLIDPAVRRWDPDRRPIGVGTRFTIRGRFQWLPIRATSRVIVWEPPTRAVFEAERPTWPLRLRATHTFDEIGNETSYTWSITVHHRDAIGRLLVRVLGPLLERTLADQARTLTTWLDDHPGVARGARL